MDKTELELIDWARAVLWVLKHNNEELPRIGSAESNWLLSRLLDDEYGEGHDEKF